MRAAHILHTAAEAEDSDVFGSCTDDSVAEDCIAEPDLRVASVAMGHKSIAEANTLVVRRRMGLQVRWWHSHTPGTQKRGYSFVDYIADIHPESSWHSSADCIAVPTLFAEAAHSAVGCTGTAAGLDIVLRTTPASASIGPVAHLVVAVPLLLLADTDHTSAVADTAVALAALDALRSAPADHTGYWDRSSLVAEVVGTVHFDNETSCQITQGFLMIHHAVATARQADLGRFVQERRRSPACRLSSVVSRNPHQALRCTSFATVSLRR